MAFTASPRGACSARGDGARRGASRPRDRAARGKTCAVCQDECVRLVRCANGHRCCVGCALCAAARCPLCREPRALVAGRARGRDGGVRAAAALRELRRASAIGVEAHRAWCRRTASCAAKRARVRAHARDGGARGRTASRLLRHADGARHVVAAFALRLASDALVCEVGGVTVVVSTGPSASTRSPLRSRRLRAGWRRALFLSGVARAPPHRAPATRPGLRDARRGLLRGAPPRRGAADARVPRVGRPVQRRRHPRATHRLRAIPPAAPDRESLFRNGRQAGRGPRDARATPGCATTPPSSCPSRPRRPQPSTSLSRGRARRNRRLYASEVYFGRISIFVQ